MSNMTVPKILKIKYKVNALTLYKDSRTPKNKLIKPVNVFNNTYKTRHFMPYISEWASSAYCYNRNVTKMLPSLDLSAYNLIKSYFDLYIIKHNNKKKTKEWRIKTKKSSTKRLLSSKPSMKHTNDRVNITVYTYDRSSAHYTGKREDMFSLDQLEGNYFAFFKNLKKIYLLLENKLERKLKDIYFKGYLRNAIINKHKLSFSNNTEYYNRILVHDETNIMRTKNNPIFISLLKKELAVVFGKNLNDYIKKVMWDEIISICYQQFIRFEQSKYEKQHIQLLIALLENVYDKKVVLDIINLKYYYNNSSIFSNVFMTKLNMKKNKINNLLGLALHNFDIPPVDKTKIYEEMYNRKRFKQNAFLKNWVSHNYPIHKEFTDINANNNDMIDTTLKVDSNMYSAIDSIDQVKKLQVDKSNTNLYKIMDSLKNKFTKGIKIEIAGRLSKRSTSQRSVYKMKYKGNVRNIDSSNKKLPTILLRGYDRSNLVYTKSKSISRTGTFGLTTSLSSN